MNKFLSVIFVLILNVVLQIIVLTNGWGLHPKSWAWIIGAGVIGQFILTAIMQKVLKSKD